jgi:hypothetical protein
MSALILLVRPILFSFLNSKAVKDLVIQLLEGYVKTTDNQIDDVLVKIVEEKLFSPQ